MSGTLRIATIAGIPIEIHASWLVIYALITWTLAVGYFPAAVGEAPVGAYWASGLIAALLLFVAVLAHELSHALVARAHGLDVRRITLHIFGGVSHLEEEAPSPRVEFFIAIVGPLTSFMIAALVWGIGGVVELGALAGAIAAYLVYINVAVGIFNLVPGFPLDGGRILRAGLWAWHGSLERATHVAARAGVAFAFALMALGVVQIFGGAVASGFWLILLGLFLRAAAEANSAQLALRAALGRVRVRDVMSTPVVSVTPDATIAEVAEQFWARRFTSFPVVDDGRVRGIVTLDHLRPVARDRWPETRVADVMVALSDPLVVRPADTALDALRKATENKVGRLVVLESGRLDGYVSLKDITHVLALHGLPPSATVARARHAIAAPSERRAA